MLLLLHISLLPTGFTRTSLSCSPPEKSKLLASHKPQQPYAACILNLQAALHCLLLFCFPITKLCEEIFFKLSFTSGSQSGIQSANRCSHSRIACVLACPWIHFSHTPFKTARQEAEVISSFLLHLKNKIESQPQCNLLSG